MAIDPYALCPCGSGKKLKFCCSDLAGDIEKIDKLAASDQPHAALQHVNRLLANDPDRASLLDFKAMLELSTNDLEAAEQTITHFLAKHPGNASAHAQSAILAAAQGNTDEAIKNLQDSLERVENVLPRQVYEAIGSVGHALLLDGKIIAARGHLLFYAGVAPPNDNRAVELLLRLNLQGGLPLLLRDNLLLAPSPSGGKQKRAFDEGARLAQRGLWRRAEAEFAKLLDKSAPQPAVVYNLAILRGWLGDERRLATGLHQFSRLDVPLDEAVEAEAIAQLVDPALDDPKLETVRLTYEITNEDAASERLVVDKRIEPYELDPESLDEEEVTRPRSTHILLDRPVPRSGADLTISQAPNVLAFLSVYGKRTDRPARLEVTTDRGELFTNVELLIAEILGDAINLQPETEVVAEKSASDEALSWRWRLPDDTPPALRRRLLSERRRRAILEDWTEAPRAALGGLSPQKAAERPDLRISLLASVMIIEQAAVDPRERELFIELRQKLGLPPATTIDSSAVDWDRLPIVRLSRLEYDKLPDDRLMQVFNRAGMTGAGLAALAAAEEIVRRPQLAESHDAAFRLLIRSEPDPDRAIQWAAQAKSQADASGKPSGQWAVLQLEVQIERGDPLAVQDVLNEIRTRHIEEPGVAEATYQLLYSAGLLTPRGPAGQPGPPHAHVGAPAPAAPASAIWTPGQDAPAAAGGNKPAIWTP